MLESWAEILLGLFGVLGASKFTQRFIARRDLLNQIGAEVQKNLGDLQPAYEHTQQLLSLSDQEDRTHWIPEQYTHPKTEFYEQIKRESKLGLLKPATIIALVEFYDKLYEIEHLGGKFRLEDEMAKRQVEDSTTRYYGGDRDKAVNRYRRAVMFDIMSTMNSSLLKGRVVELMLKKERRLVGCPR